MKEFKKIFIYDFEVLPHFWGVVFKESKTGKVIEIRNNIQEFKDFMYHHKNDSLFVGYNSKGYDDNIIRALMAGYEPYELSKWIINGNKPYDWFKIKSQSTYFKYFEFMSHDLMNEVITRNNFGMSLKQYEAYSGMDIVESEVNFELDRKLTQEEEDSLMKYCVHDVNATHLMFNEQDQQDLLLSKYNLAKMIKEPLYKNIGKSIAQMAAKIMKAKKKSYDQKELKKYIFPKNLKIKNQQVLDFFKGEIKPNMSLEVIIAGLINKLGLGGLHGAKSAYTSLLFHILIDVALT